MNKIFFKVIVLWAAMASALSLSAQLAGGLRIDWSTLDGGAGTCAGGGFAVSGTIGQPDVGTLRSGSYTFIGGFWAGQISPNNPRTDSDRDGIPDEWERSHGLNPGDPNDARLDSDGDGMTDLEEYVANTHPLDPQSYFVLTVSGVGPSPMISWISNPDRLYRIWMRDSVDPNTPWLDSGFGIIQPVAGVGPSPMRAEFGVGPSPMYRLFGVGPSPLREVSGVGPSPMRIIRIEVMLPPAGR